MSVPTSCEAATKPDLTIRDYSQQLKVEAAQAPTFVAHTCEHCAKIVVKCQSVAQNVIKINCVLEGLSLDLLYLGAAGGCPLYTQWLQYPDWDSFNEGTQWRFNLRISHRSHFTDATGEVVKKGEDAGFETLLRALDEGGVEFADLTPRYLVSLGEGEQTPGVIS